MTREPAYPLRSLLNKAESHMRAAIEGVRAGDDEAARRALEQARERYEEFADRSDDDALKLVALGRRVHSRIERTIAALDDVDAIEHFDVLSEDGSPSGRTEPSTLAHMRGTPHASVVVIPFDGAGRVLLQLRSPIIAIFPGKWTFAATGHLSAGQTAIEAAHAETNEEIAAAVSAEAFAKLDEATRRGVTSKTEGSRRIALVPDPAGLGRIGELTGHAGSLLIAEFIYLDDVELEALRKAATGLAKSGAGESVVNRILVDIDTAAKTMFLFTHGADRLEALMETIGSIESATDIRCGMITDNREWRHGFVYRLAEEEIDLIATIARLKRERSRDFDESLTTDFDWVDFDRLVESFAAEPEKYTDGFVPFLSDPKLAGAIRSEVKSTGTD